jgi:hypothetical protein
MSQSFKDLTLTNVMPKELKDRIVEAYGKSPHAVRLLEKNSPEMGDFLREAWQAASQEFTPELGLRLIKNGQIDVLMKVAEKAIKLRQIYFDWIVALGGDDNDPLLS